MMFEFLLIGLMLTLVPCFFGFLFMNVYCFYEWKTTKKALDMLVRQRLSKQKNEEFKMTVTVHLITGEHIPCRNIQQFNLRSECLILRGIKTCDYYEFDRRKMIGFDVAFTQKEVGNASD